MLTTKQVLIGITITSITLFICSQFLKFGINDSKKEKDTEDSAIDERIDEKKIRKHNKKNKKKKPEISKNVKTNQNKNFNVKSKNELLIKLEKLFSKRNFKIIEKIITQMLEESEHEKYLEWLSNQENNIYIKTFGKNKNNKKINKNINICVVSKKDIVPGEIIYTEKPVVSILNPYLDKEEYCPTCFKKIILPDNIVEKKENFCSKECESKAKEDKRLFKNIFISDKTSEKSYLSSMSSCYGISTYDIESEIIYYDYPEVETIHIESTKPNNMNPPQKSQSNNRKMDQNDDNHKSDNSDNILFYYTDEPSEKDQPFEIHNDDDKQDIEIIKLNDFYNYDKENMDDQENDSQLDPIDIDKESFLQLFDSKTKSTTTSGVNEKIITYYHQLCWEKEYFYPLLILKLLVLIIQDELCFKKKIKLLNCSNNNPLFNNDQHHPPLHYQKSPKKSKSIGDIMNKNNKAYTLSPPSTPLNPNQKLIDNLVIYTLWDHIETFPYIENFSKSTSNNDLEINNEFSNNDLKFFNLIHTLFYDVFYEFEDFFTDDMYQILKQKILYNTIGITSNETIKIKKNIKDIYRSDNDKSILGLGIYFISSYIRHSCHPNAKICYLSNSNNLSLISTQYIKKGEEITISYIDTQNKSHKEYHEELYNKFKIKCFCNK
ncbi:SET domain-containing protein [Piromyces finnis]|uniref:SET domain-containing protein n=1 Tax=Piromyces finnis TaxID=1754191 RepID=A0A1Y1VCV6_9FUNG|nr:SET domain-containing protein [Piromyces finnis]|eukprot:ORX52114.1 SET domain-containing protein [Piromyces finnis]